MEKSHLDFSMSCHYKSNYLYLVTVALVSPDVSRAARTAFLAISTKDSTEPATCSKGLALNSHYSLTNHFF